MQAVDNRESRLRKAFAKIETLDGRLRGGDIKRLLTVISRIGSPADDKCADQGLHEVVRG